MAIENLEAEKKRLLQQITRLERDVAKYKAVQKLIDEAARQGRDLKADVRLLWKFEPIIAGLKRVLNTPDERDPLKVLEKAAETLAELRRRVASLETATSDSQEATARYISELEMALAGEKKRKESEIEGFKGQISRLETEKQEIRDELKKIRRDRRGRGDPPCWEDARVRVVPVFHIDILDDGFTVRYAWTDEFKEQAQANEHIMNMLQAAKDSRTGVIGISRFRQLANKIWISGKRRTAGKESCVYYVNTKDATKTAGTYSKNRRVVDRYFYPYRTN